VTRTWRCAINQSSLRDRSSQQRHIVWPQASYNIFYVKSTHHHNLTGSWHYHPNALPMTNSSSAATHSINPSSCSKYFMTRIFMISCLLPPDLNFSLLLPSCQFFLFMCSFPLFLWLSVLLLFPFLFDFLSPFVFPLLFHPCFVFVLLAYVVSLAFANLFGTKRLVYCCCLLASR
jgi:hypothetical protein